MYRVDRNNFYKNKKSSNIETPKYLCNFLFDLLKDKIKKIESILDPCCGNGALLKPFEKAGYDSIIGFDICELDQSYKKMDYLSITTRLVFPKLVIMNPPFNLTKENEINAKKYCQGRPLMSEVFLKKTIELFGEDIQIVLFTPYGFRLNQTTNSNRWNNFVSGVYPEILSIISLPKNIFKDIQFHSEILIFNIKGLKPHYFYEFNKK